MPQHNAAQQTAERMAEALIRLAATGPVEAHHLSQAGFTRDDIARHGRQAIDLAARRRPDLHHPGNAVPPELGPDLAAATKTAYAVRGPGRPGRRQFRKAGAR